MTAMEAFLLSVFCGHVVQQMILIEAIIIRKCFLL